jgi:hypothetical protein
MKKSDGSIVFEVDFCIIYSKKVIALKIFVLSAKKKEKNINFII